MRNALLNSLKWFENSGVMLPADGLWGVAERVAVISGNSAIEEMKREFHAWTIHDGYCIIEQRRADCNFETAYLYLLAFEVFGDKKYYDIAVNILDFLYFRSGLLNRSQKEYQPGSWNWSHIKRENCVFFDDEAWCVFFQLVIGETYPELETRYDMRHWALILADSLHAGAQKVMLEKFLTPDGHWVDYSKHWLGSLDLPHWGSLTCMALAKADKAANRKPAAFIRQYYDYLAPVAENFNPSEMAYATLGATAAYRYSQDPFFLEMAVKFGKLLTEKMQENGNLPAEHYEAPTGPHLVDTIYTANWSLLALQSLGAIAPTFAPYYEKIKALILSIQDDSDEPQFSGCWRGMFDLNANSWGGGDRFEGGAGSIYTGWTNAPIASVIAMDILGKDLFVR